MKSVFLYAITRDYGFAPNPFYGVCTLATCKPRMRKSASKGDWVIAYTGKNLSQTKRCVCAMKITDKMTFNEYWYAPEFRCKKPIRNGSRKTLVGDNVYNKQNGEWIQADCHHSSRDGSPNPANIIKDTGSDNVLISEHFYYFGKAAPEIPLDFLISSDCNKTIRDYRRMKGSEGDPYVKWIESNFKNSLNLVMDDPYDFASSQKRYDALKDKVT